MKIEELKRMKIQEFKEKVRRIIEERIEEHESSIKEMVSKGNYAGAYEMQVAIAELMLLLNELEYEGIVEKKRSSEVKDETEREELKKVEINLSWILSKRKRR
ncbi:MAG: hypothetical protein ACP5H3_02880 [Candidatus Aenigmatarchaeota archaeon]|jgi:uncharacterized protein YjgD (DUF1641 family)